MTDQSPNYANALKWAGNQAGTTHAILDAADELRSIAEELRAIRELLAERLAEPEPVYYQLGTDGPKIPLEGHGR